MTEPARSEADPQAWDVPATVDPVPESSVAAPEKPRGESQLLTRNIFSLGSSELVARAVAFVGTTYMARVLGPTSFGIIGFAAALFSYLMLAVGIGFDSLGAREVVRRPDEAASLAGGVIVLRLGLAVLALLGVVALALTLDKPPVVKLVLVLMGLSFFSVAVDTGWVYKGLQRNHQISKARILGQILYVGAVFLVVKGPADVVRVPLAQFFGEMSAALLLTIPLLQLRKARPDLKRAWRLLRDSGPVMGMALLRTLIYTFDVLLIGLLLNEEQVGLYAAPYRICMVLVSVAAALHVSYLPLATRAADQGVAAIGDVARRSIGFSVAVGAPLIVGGMMVAPALLQLVFGAAYTPGANAFRLLILSIGFIFLHGNIYNLILAADRMKVLVRITALAAALNIGLNFIVIPRYGLVGAAASTVAAEGLIFLLGLRAIRAMGVRVGARPFLAPLPAAIAMGIALFLLAPLHSLFLSLGVGSLVYLLALIVSGGVPEDGQPHLKSLIALGSRASRR